MASPINFFHQPLIFVYSFQIYFNTFGIIPPHHERLVFRYFYWIGWFLCLPLFFECPSAPFILKKFVIFKRQQLALEQIVYVQYFFLVLGKNGILISLQMLQPPQYYLWIFFSFIIQFHKFSILTGLKSDGLYRVIYEGYPVCTLVETGVLNSWRKLFKGIYIISTEEYFRLVGMSQCEKMYICRWECIMSV